MKTACLSAIGLMLLIAVSYPASAQSYVEGVSAIIGSGTSSTQIETYSETYETADIAYYYEAYVQGFVYQNGAEINSGYALGSPYANDAYGYLTSPLHVPDTYEIQSDHYVVAYYTYIDPNTGITYYDNPDYFTNDGSFGGSNDFAPGSSSCGCYYETVDYIYLGSTAVVMSSAPPAISGISPPGVSLGDSGTLTVTGTALVDVFTQTTTVNISGTGISWSVGSQTATQVTINYSVSTSAATGSRTLTLSTRFGSSSTTFNVGDGTPVVTSISPSTWNAGATTSVTFGGNNFGTAPTLSFSSSQVTATITSSSNTQIVANITVAAAAPAETVQVTVTSHGYNGSGFIQTDNNPPSITDTANINPIAAPAPTLQFFGTNITATLSVYVGQEISLSSSVSLPSGLVVTSSSWSPSGTYVGGYDTSSQGQVVVPTLTQTSTKFYWVYPGQSLTAKYSYCMNNNQCSSPVQATFNVSGPTSPSVSAPTGQMNVLAGPKLQFGGTSTNIGIKFTASATLPSGNSGAYSWAQLINNDNISIVTSSGSQSCKPNGFVTSSNPELDNQYPYPPVTSNSTNDNPAISLPASWGEVARSFNATMYLLWTPTADSRCNAGTCTIPVPLGSISGSSSWHCSGDAINTLSTSTGDSGTTWKLSCQKETTSPAPFHASQPSDPFNGYPTWTQTYKNVSGNFYSYYTCN